MLRDIDQTIERLKAELPGIRITQLQAVHLGSDDDGLWFIKMPGRAEEAQIESSSGDCPFLIESDFDDKRHEGATIEEVISIVKGLYA